jgi:uncharacterized protein YjiS (DUF1127 family)
MSSELLQRDDLSVYVLAGLPKSFGTKLRKIVAGERENAEVMQLDEEMTEWLVAQLAGEKRRPHERTPASAALWRAYRALSAARYHLQDRPEEERVRELRRLVEDLWRDISPQHLAGEEPDEAGDEPEEKEE